MKNLIDEIVQKTAQGWLGNGFDYLKWCMLSFG